MNETIVKLEERISDLEDKLSFFKLATEKNPQQIWILNQKGDMIIVSETLKNMLVQMTGIDCEDFSGMNLYAIFSSLGTETLVKMIKRNDTLTLQRDEVMVFEEAVQLGGKQHTFISYKKRLIHPNTKEKYLLGMSIDISERKYMEVEMLKMMQEMELADKTKRTFIQNFRHDLKTPISNIIGAADLMLHNRNDDQEFFLDSIKTSGEQLLSYVDQLSDVTVSPKAVLPVSIETFDIRDEIGSVIKGVNAIANVKKLAVQLEVADAVPEKINSDPIRLHRILSNLIGNAIKYTEEGHVKVEIDYLTAKDGAVLEIHVIDTGVGIDDRFKQLIFSPMMRIRKSDGLDIEGAGLGLSIVKDFISELSGQISVSSTPQGGSRFIIMIPLPLV